MSKFSEHRNPNNPRRVTTEPELVVTQERRKNNFDRRSFIKLFTASASAVVLEACGGSGVGGADNGLETSPLPVTTPRTPSLPTWSAIPTLTFVQGVASSIPVGQYVSNATAATLSVSTGTLPAGVTFNPATRAFDYDGKGAVGGADGLVLTARV